METYGQNFKYQDFASEFRAELWDPEYWADLFVRSGAKYVVPTSKHHVRHWYSSHLIFPGRIYHVAKRSVLELEFNG